MTASENKINPAQIGVSISASHVPPGSGYRNDEPTTNELTLNLSKCLITHGYAVAVGHDWRPGGIMMALYEFAEAHDVNAGIFQSKSSFLYNYMYSGMESGLEPWEEEQIEGVMELVKCSKPTGIECGPSAFTRARALSRMRGYMTTQLSARVCLGGKDPANPEDMSTGRLPGVLEEILFSLAAKQPLYLSGLFGGVTEWVVNTLFGEQPNPMNFTLSKELQKSYSQQSSTVSSDDFQEVTDESVALDMRLLQKSVKVAGFKSICQHNGLTENQNKQMMRSQTLEEFTHWVLIGLDNIRNRF